MSEMIDLGIKYAEEHGIDTKYTKRQKAKLEPKLWEPDGLS